MKKILKNKSCCAVQVVFPAFLACLTLLFTMSKDGGVVFANENALSAMPIELRVDKQNHARAFCYGIKTVLRIGDFCEFYDKNIDGSRKRIFSGPWAGSLEENISNTYTLTGNDPASGVSYTIVFKQLNPSAIELFMTLKAPSRPSNFDSSILKLSGDLFKGASIEASPGAINDAYEIPMQPLPVGKHILLEGKNRVLLKASLCDLEIRDLMESNTILAADFRDIPWDNTKSIYFGAGKKNLEPGQSFSCRYSILCLPPSHSTTLQEQSVSEGRVSAVSPWSLFCLPPKAEIKGSGQYKLRQQDSIYGMPSGTAENILGREIERLTSMQLTVKDSEQGTGNSGLFIERIPQGSHLELPPDGFEVITSQEKVVLRGVSDRACLYAAYAFMGRLKHEANEWEMECGTIRDWPDLSVRGVCIELLKPEIHDLGLMKSYLDAFSKARSNVLIFLHNPKQMRSWLRNQDDGGWTKEQITEAAQYARSLHMDVWGGMLSKFEAADFSELEISKGANIYNPLKNSSYKYLFSLYEEILQTYRPSTLLIGHDEITGLSIYSAESSKSSADILAMDVGRIHDWLGKKGAKTAMWGDMLLDYNVWQAKVGAANSQNPLFNSGSTHQALGKIPSDVMILDWHYLLKGSYASIDYFARNGFRVCGSPWHDPQAALSFAQSVKKYAGNGIIATDWGLWRTLSPAATTLCSPLFGWRSDWPNEIDELDVAALAHELRGPLYHSNYEKDVQRLLSLESAFNNTTYDAAANDGIGVFDYGPVLDLRFAPIGSGDFNGVSFDLSDAAKGDNKNCIVAVHDNAEDTTMPEKISIPVAKQKAKALAFLHTCYVKEPQYRSRKLGQYIIEFETGVVSSIDLIEGYNITDVRSSVGLRNNDWSFFRSPDILIGSELAWRGQSANGIPLNLQKLIWKNPFPELKIKKISIQCSDIDEYFRIALLAVTILNEAPKDLPLSPPTSPTVLTNPEK